MKAIEAYISGIGQSEIGMKLTRHPLLLTIDAVKEALAEAGLTIGQIDGVSTYPGRVAAMPGFSPVGADELVDALGIKATWYAGGGEITSQLGAVVAAAAAVRCGQARHVICFRTVYEAAAMATSASTQSETFTGFEYSARHACARSWPVTTPSRADRVCNKTAIRFDIRRTQSSP